MNHFGFPQTCLLDSARGAEGSGRVETEGENESDGKNAPDGQDELLHGNTSLWCRSESYRGARLRPGAGKAGASFLFLESERAPFFGVGQQRGALHGEYCWLTRAKHSAAPIP
jgi:hypothetical protein